MVNGKEIVIADASPLIAFGKIKRLPLLTAALGKLLASQTVIEECTHDLHLPGAREISEALKSGLIIKTNDPDNIKEHQGLFDILGKGEATSIILAKQLNAGLLIDEKLGRETANNMKLRVIGTAGVLLLAKKNGLIKCVNLLLSELRIAGYYLSDELVKTVLTRADE